jgi:hypothetical protein
VIAINPVDSLLYSLRDSTLNVSPAMRVRVLNVSSTGADSVSVPGYLVSYAITYPTDTLLAQLVGGDGVRPSRVDTTASDGTAAQLIRVRPVRLSAVNDSVVVLATVKYHGAPIAGSPVRLVLLVKPGA